MFIHQFAYSEAILPVYDNEDGELDSNEDGTDPTGNIESNSDGSTPGETNSEGTVEKKFTQADVDKAVKDKASKIQRQNAKHTARLEEEYQKRINDAHTTEEDKESLAAALEDLRKQNRTSEENAKIEKKRQQERHKTELDEARQDAETWKERYTTNTVARDITDACVSADVMYPNQVVSMWKTDAKLVEILTEDGGRTGKYRTMVDLQKTDSDSGEQFIAQMTPTDALEYLKEVQGNLFRPNIIPGIGGSSNSSATPGADGKFAIKDMDPAEYRRLRSENPNLLDLL